MFVELPQYVEVKKRTWPLQVFFIVSTTPTSIHPDKNNAFFFQECIENMGLKLNENAEIEAPLN